MIRVAIFEIYGSSLSFYLAFSARNVFRIAPSIDPAVNYTAGNRNATRNGLSIYAAQTDRLYDRDIHDNKIAVARSDRPESMFARNQIPRSATAIATVKLISGFSTAFGDVYMYRGNARDYGIDGNLKKSIDRGSDIIRAKSTRR